MANEGDGEWVRKAVRDLDLGWNLDIDRARLFEINQSNRWKFWGALNAAFKRDPELMAQFGLKKDLPRFDDKGKVRDSRNRDAATTFEVFSVRPARRLASDGSFRTELIAVVHQRQPVPWDKDDPTRGFFWFRGGATVIIDPRPGREQIRYSIIKNSNSDSRRERQRQFGREIGLSPLRGLYFGGQSVEPFALMHGRLGEY
jgi:hypothetical protein